MSVVAGGKKNLTLMYGGAVALLLVLRFAWLGPQGARAEAALFSLGRDQAALAKLTTGPGMPLPVAQGRLEQERGRLEGKAPASAGRVDSVRRSSRSRRS